MRLDTLRLYAGIFCCSFIGSAIGNTMAVLLEALVLACSGGGLEITQGLVIRFAVLVALTTALGMWIAPKIARIYGVNP